MARDRALDLAPELRVVEHQNEWIVRSRYDFAYEPWDAPRLATLRERYGLDDVIASGATEWDQLLLLREWVHTRWSHGWATADPNDALDILAKAEQGSEFNCGYYCTTFLQCALALGFQARRLGVSKADTAWIASDEGNVGHSVPEVWSQDWHRWVVLDPDANTHYERDGRPCSALDIHAAWISGHWRDLAVVRGSTPFRATSRGDSGYESRFSAQHIADMFADFTRNRVADYFHQIRWEMRNNLFASRDPVPGLRWFDHATLPQLVYANRPIGDDNWTCDERDAYWTLNQAQISLRLIGDDLRAPRVRLVVDHSMPNLDRVLIKIGDDGAWETYREPITWPICPGKNVVEAKPVSRFGRTGYTSRVVLRFMGGQVQP